jgi:hypothetical protein
MLLQVPTDDPDEPDGLDEAIVPCDMNLILDDDLRNILSKLPPDAKFTMVAGAPIWRQGVMTFNPVMNAHARGTFIKGKLVGLTKTHSELLFLLWELCSLKLLGLDNTAGTLCELNCDILNPAINVVYAMVTTGTRSHPAP